jgi:hypothetical protein
MKRHNRQILLNSSKMSTWIIHTTSKTTKGP